MYQDIALDKALSAITETTTGDALATILHETPMFSQRGILLSAAVLHGRPAATYVLLEAGCLNEEKKDALVGYLTTSDLPGVSRNGKALAAAMVLDSGFFETNFTNLIIGKIGTVTGVPPLAVASNLRRANLADLDVPAPPLRPADTLLNTVLQHVLPVEARPQTVAAMQVLQHSYPLYTKLTELGGRNEAASLQPQQMPHLCELLGRGGGPAQQAHTV